MYFGYDVYLPGGFMCLIRRGILWYEARCLYEMANWPNICRKHMVNHLVNNAGHCLPYNNYPDTAKYIRSIMASYEIPSRKNWVSVNTMGAVEPAIVL